MSSATEMNRQTWWGQDATRILDYIEKYRGHMSDFEVLEDDPFYLFGEGRLAPF